MSMGGDANSVAAPPPLANLRARCQSAKTTRGRSSPAGRRCGPMSARGRSPTRAPRCGRRGPAAGRGADSSYVLEMLPYPSGEPHIGHLKVYSVGDAIAHYHRRLGPARAAPDGLRLVRAARGEPRDQDGRAPARRPRTPRSPPSSASSASGGSRSTGRASWRRTNRATTAGRSGSSCSCSTRASPTARRRRSSGARKTRRCSRTSRSTRRDLRALRRDGGSAGSWSSGSCASPTTRSGCWTIWRRSSGPST